MRRAPHRRTANENAIRSLEAAVSWYKQLVTCGAITTAYAAALVADANRATAAATAIVVVRIFVAYSRATRCV